MQVFKYTYINTKKSRQGVFPVLRGRPVRRGGAEGPQEDLCGRHARQGRPGTQEDQDGEPPGADRRDRQDGPGVAGRSHRRPPRDARPRAELLLPGSLPRRGGGPVQVFVFVNYL